MAEEINARMSMQPNPKYSLVGILKFFLDENLLGPNANPV
jgi:hypothetical protein